MRSQITPVAVIPSPPTAEGATSHREFRFSSATNSGFNPTHGFIWSEQYTLHDAVGEQLYVSSSAVWAAGWVILDNKMLVRVLDMWKLLYNVLVRQDYWRLHYHQINKHDSITVSNKLCRLRHRELVLKVFFTTSLRPLK